MSGEGGCVESAGEAVCTLQEGGEAMGAVHRTNEVGGVSCVDACRRHEERMAARASEHGNGDAATKLRLRDADDHHSLLEGAMEMSTQTRLAFTEPDVTVD